MTKRDSKGRFIIGHKSPKEWKIKNSNYHKGRKIDDITREKIRVKLRGDNNPSKRPEVREKISKSKLGIKRPIEVINKISLTRLGKPSILKGKKLPQRSREKCHFWKGGITTITKQIRTSLKYKQWRSEVFQRDNWTCQTCNNRGCYLEAHHIKQFIDIFNENNIHSLSDAENCEELWDINNGVTLCIECHNLTKQGKKQK
jgi:5-methylcytosine-specific restriction endonuclease McrA